MSNGVRLDFDGDGTADILLHDLASGAMQVWAMGLKGIGAVLEPPALATSAEVVGNGDYNGDGYADILSLDGPRLEVRLMVGATMVGGGTLTTNFADASQVATSADFSGDGRDDIVVRHTATGQVEVWTLDGATILAVTPLGQAPGSRWLLAGSGDFDGDGWFDLLWRKTNSGRLDLWLLEGLGVAEVAVLVNENDWAGYDVVGVGKYDRNGQHDVLLRHRDTGELAVMLLERISSGVSMQDYDIGFPEDLGSPDLALLEVVASGDFNGDGRVDIALRHIGNGKIRVWYLDGREIIENSEVQLGDPGASWIAVGVGAENPLTRR